MSRASEAGEPVRYVAVGYLLVRITVQLRFGSLGAVRGPEAQAQKPGRRYARQRWPPLLAPGISSLVVTDDFSPWVYVTERQLAPP